MFLLHGLECVPAVAGEALPYVGIKGTHGKLLADRYSFGFLFNNAHRYEYIERIVHSSFNVFLFLLTGLG